MKKHSTISRNKPLSYGPQQLFIAAASGNLRLIKRILSRGVSVNVPCHHLGSALNWSIYAENFEVAEFLLRNGADPAMFGRLGNNALHLLALVEYGVGDIETYMRLLTRLASNPVLTKATEGNGNTPLACLAHCHTTPFPERLEEMVSLLAPEFSYFKNTNCSERTPMEIVAESRCDEIKAAFKLVEAKHAKADLQQGLINAAAGAASAKRLRM